MNKMEKITADYIISILKDKVEKKEAQFDANFWVESALKLNLLLGDEHDKLANLAFEVAQLRGSILQQQTKNNVSEARMVVESSPKYLEYRKQELKVKRIEEFIKIAKRMSSVANGM